MVGDEIYRKLLNIAQSIETTEWWLLVLQIYKRNLQLAQQSSSHFRMILGFTKFSNRVTIIKQTEQLLHHLTGLFYYLPNALAA